MNRKVNFRKLTIIFFIMVLLPLEQLMASQFSDNTFLIARGELENKLSDPVFTFLSDNQKTGIEIDLNDLGVDSKQFATLFEEFLSNLESVIDQNKNKILPVFIQFNGNIQLLDSLVNSSGAVDQIFFNPQGEKWPSTEYMVQSNRRLILFVSGNFHNQSQVFHKIDDYTFLISARSVEPISAQPGVSERISKELFLIDDFDKLPGKTNLPSNYNLNTEYINFLLTNWTRYGKRPNFLFAGESYDYFKIILHQLNSFTLIKGSVRFSGKTMEKVYWKNQDIAITGGNFCFPYRGGEEVMLSPFVPGFKLIPEQIIVTGEMEIPKNNPIIATPLEIHQSLKGKFTFDQIILNELDPTQTFEGENFTLTNDIDRGSVIKLPDGASVNLGNPERYGLRNSSFTVSCFVKFSEVLVFGDNAILGNYEREYRRGLHLILRSGHPYFGLWANDYVSDAQLVPNKWYHMAWRYTLETGEQAIFLDGKNIGSSSGHPAFAGTANILLGSALSEGASLRGYVDDLLFWNRPLGIEEINRLSLNETVTLPKTEANNMQLNDILKWVLLTVGIVLVGIIVWFIIRRSSVKVKSAAPATHRQENNCIELFNGFEAINMQGENVSSNFTPKVRELFLFVFLNTLRNEQGASIEEINRFLWPGNDHKKVANSRAVTLNKLRKILSEFEGVEVRIQGRNILLHFQNPFFCDYAEAIRLSQVQGGMSRSELETFFALVRKGSLLKGIPYEWLDDYRGFTGNQVIDNLLKLAKIYMKDRNLGGLEAISKRILNYDDLNEEAIFLQIWVLNKRDDSHLAKYNFTSFRAKYMKIMGEEFALDYNDFLRVYSEKI